MTVLRQHVLVLSMQWLPSAQLTPSMLDELRALACASFAGDFTDDDLQHALGGDHVVVRMDGRLVSHAAVVPRVLFLGRREVRAGYVEAVATLPAEQGKGLGTRGMRAAGAMIRERYDMGALSTSLPEFYVRLGWERWRGPSWVLGSDGAPVRTADEDDGLMVLRCPATADVDVRWPITCHDRPGDAW